uniref:ABC transporter family protein n=1 Tax=Caenorhabditis tropicalis TaxID=1561998 RepID=A0A1I7U162_9PELO
MSYTFGEVSQVLVTITNAINNKTIDPADLEKAYEVYEHDMNRVILHFFLCGCAYFTFGSLQFSIMKFVGDNTTYRVRKQYISRLLRKDAQYFDSMSTGHLSTVLNDNLERFREVFNEKIALIIAFLTDFTVGTALAFYTDWRLASYGIFFSLGIGFSGLINSASMMKTTNGQNTHYGNAGSIAFQTLGAFKTVCSLNGQKTEIERYTKELKAGEKYGCQRAFFYSISRGVTYFFCNALNTVVLYFGANMIYSGTLETATVVRLFHFLLFGAFCLSEALPHVSRLTAAIASTAPIAEMLTRNNNEIEKEEEADDGVEIDGRIAFKDVRFSYPTRPDAQVLKGISFDVNNGECIALVGASGSGKSTVVQLLLHYYNIESGKILIDGIELNNINLKKLRRVIGVVSQEPVLFNTTIEENIRFGNPIATLPEIYGALRKANAYDFVCAFPKGIKTIVGERGTQLSGGQKQRIAIARTLVRNPKILLLDEATSALDNESEHVVQKALENASQGRTTIVVAHRLSTIRNASKIIVMQRGEIVEVGNHDDLIAKQGIYNDLVQAQLLDSNDDQNELPPLAARQLSHELSPLHSYSFQRSTSTDAGVHDDEMERLLDELTQEGAKKSNLREIVKMCKPDYFILFLAVFGSAIQGISYPILAQLIVRTYKGYAMQGEDMLTYSHFWALSFMSLAIFRPLTLYLQYYYFGKVAEQLSTRLRVKSFKHMLSLPCAFYDNPNHSATKLSNRLNTDSSNVKAAVDDRLGCVIMTLVAISIAVATASYYCWKMTLEVLMFFPLLYLAEYCYEAATENAIQEDSIAFENSNRTAIEALENVRTVRALNLEDKVMSLITNHLQKIHNSYFKRAIIQGAANGLSMSCFLFVYSISFKFGTYLARKHEVQPMDTYLVLMTLSMTANMAGSAAAYLPDYKKAVHAAGLIFHLFTYPATMPYESKDGKKNIEKGEIVGENLQFHYDQRPDRMILDGVNLKVEPGKTLALVGPSGCGKSTIISLLERFYHAVDGEIKIDNANVEDINLHHLRANLALVSQEPTLFNCSIRENLLYGLTRSVPQLEIEKSLQTANAFHFVYQFPQGLETIVGERGAQLSGGQKQRIAIARAILRNPKVLLLDEATSALDSDSEKVVQNALDTASERLSTVVVAHRLSTVVNADSIAVLKTGKVAEQGTHEELLRQRNIYWRLVQKQGIQVQAPTD